jgi:hypothetical protein
MTQGPGAEGAPDTFADQGRAPGQDVLAGLGELERRELLAWVGEHPAASATSGSAAVRRGAWWQASPPASKPGPVDPLGTEVRVPRARGRG